MQSRDLQKLTLPDKPGVYIFKKGKKLLYIGKAASLRDRVRSYFASNLRETRGPAIAEMVRKADRVSFKKTDSALEALLLEAELIKKLEPPHNREGKDGKSFNCVVITDEDFPRVLIVRKKDIDFASYRLITSNLKLKTIHGPFPHGLQLRLALKLIRKIFPYRDACYPYPNRRPSAFYPRQSTNPKPCFNRQLGLCPGVCTGEIDRKEYAKIIRNLRLFFRGRKSRLLRLLQREMHEAAKSQNFERAGELKRQIFALNHIQDIALLKAANYPLPTTNFRIEAYDISHFGGKEIVGAMAVVESGEAKKSEYRLFKLRGLPDANEVRGLTELLARRFAHPEWEFPKLIVVDGNEVQKRTAERAIRSLKLSIPVVALVKDEKHRPRELLGDETLANAHRAEIFLSNSEAHRFALKFQRQRRSHRAIS